MGSFFLKADWPWKSTSSWIFSGSIAGLLYVNSKKRKLCKWINRLEDVQVHHFLLDSNSLDWVWHYSREKVKPCRVQAIRENSNDPSTCWIDLNGIKIPCGCARFEEFLLSFWAWGTWSNTCPKRQVAGNFWAIKRNWILNMNLPWKSKTKQRMVFRIHIKESLLPMGKVWSAWTPWVCLGDKKRCMHYYLEPVCPQFLKVNLLEQGRDSNQNKAQGSFGFQVYIYIYII